MHTIQRLEMFAHSSSWNLYEEENGCYVMRKPWHYAILRDEGIFGTDLYRHEMIQSFSCVRQILIPRIPADYNEWFDRSSTLPIVLYNSLERYLHAIQYALLRSSVFLVDPLLLTHDNNTDYQITDSHLCTNSSFRENRKSLYAPICAFSDNWRFTYVISLTVLK